jgi:putative membrane protein
MKPYRIILLAFFALVCIWSVIDPLSLRNWFLESSPSLIAVSLIAIFDKKLKFSDLSFTLIVVYFALPFVNAHYGVTHVPFGETVAQWFGSDRNAYDRLVHFASGFLGFVPLRELFVRLTKHRSYWSYIIPFMFVMGLGALYEVGELLAAIANPSAGITFTGAQGDLWDSAKDLACAAVGASLTIIMMSIGTLFQKK